MCPYVNVYIAWLLIWLNLLYLNELFLLCRLKVRQMANFLASSFTHFSKIHEAQISWIESVHNVTRNTRMTIKQLYSCFIAKLSFLFTPKSSILSMVSCWLQDWWIRNIFRQEILTQIWYFFMWRIFNLWCNMSIETKGNAE